MKCTKVLNLAAVCAIIDTQWYNLIDIKCGQN